MPRTIGALPRLRARSLGRGTGELRPAHRMGFARWTRTRFSLEPRVSCLPRRGRALPRAASGDAPLRGDDRAEPVTALGTAAAILCYAALVIFQHRLHAAGRPLTSEYRRPARSPTAAVG